MDSRDDVSIAAIASAAAVAAIVIAIVGGKTFPTAAAVTIVVILAAVLASWGFVHRSQSAKRENALAVGPDATGVAQPNAA